MVFTGTRPIALVTGLGGFTGRYLAPLLEAQGYRVVGIEAAAQDCPYELHTCSLLDREALADIVKSHNPLVVAHLAAISFVAHGDADAIYRTNVVGTRNLLEALSACVRRPKAVLLASSANIYGNTLVNPIAEDTPPEPANDYAVSKLAMEYLARTYMGSLPITMVRPFNYTGVGQSDIFLLPKIVNHFKRGARVIELGNLDVARDFSDVRSVVSAYARLLELAPNGQVFNVCSGQAHTLQQVLDIAARIAGYALEVQINPAFVRFNEVKTLCGDPGKLNAALGPQAQIALTDTLAWMFGA